MRRVPFLLILAALLAATVVGCTGDQTTPTSNVPTLEVTPTSGESPTPRPTTVPGAAACRAVPSPLESLPSAEGLPPVGEGDYPRGPTDALVTVIEYADFQ